MYCYLVLLVALAGVCSAANETTLFGLGNAGTENRVLPVSTSAVVLALDANAKTGQANYIVRFEFEWDDQTAYQTVMETTKEVINGSRACEMYCSGPNGLCCDGIYPLKLDNVNAVGTPSVDTSMYFSATNSSVLQVSTMRGTMYNHIHMKSYPFGTIEWAMCNRLSATTPGFAPVPVLPIPDGSGATQSAFAPSSTGWELLNVNYFAGWQLNNAEASNGGYTVHALGYARNYSYGEMYGDVTREAGSSLLWANSVVQDSAVVVLAMEEQVTLRTKFTLIFPICLLALMNVAIYLQDADKYATRFTSANIVFLSASNYMGSFMVGGRGLSAAQTLTVIVLGMLVFTVSSSFVWFKLHSGRSVRQDMMDMWYLCGGKWKELAEPLNQDPGGSTKDAVEGDGLAETDSSKQRALSSGTSRGACPHTSDASFIEHFRQDQSFKTRICLLGDNLSMIFTLIVYIVGFTLIIVLGEQSQERVLEVWDVCQTQTFV